MTRTDNKKVGKRTDKALGKSMPRINIRIKEPTTKTYAKTEYIVHLDGRGRIIIPQAIRDRLLLDDRQALRLWINDEKGLYCEIVTVSEVQKFMKDFGVSYKQMTYIWEYIIPFSNIVSEYARQGYEWTDMAYPTLVSILRKYKDLVDEGRIVEDCREKDVIEKEDVW